MERVKLHGGPWDGRIIERRWSGTPEMQLALTRPIEHDPDGVPVAGNGFEIHVYALMSQDDDKLWHYFYTHAKPGHVRGPAIEDTGR